MAVGIIRSLQIGQVRRYGDDTAARPHERAWETAFYKKPVRGPVEVTKLGCVGDEVADRFNHGGVDKAMLCYSADHWSAWVADCTAEATTPPTCEPGSFGENITVSGLTEQTVCIGDRWQTGSVTLEVSQPRQPCWKLGRRHRMTDLPKRVVKTGRSGWYLRVIRAGEIEAGDSMTLLSRPNEEWTVSRANNLYYRKDVASNEIRALADLPELAAAWKTDLSSRLPS